MLVGVLTMALIGVTAPTNWAGMGLVLAVVVASGVAAVLNAGFGPSVVLVSDISTIPDGLPLPIMPAWGDIAYLLVPALSLALVCTVQGAGVSAGLPTSDGQPPDATRDILGQGVGNLVSALFRDCRWAARCRPRRCWSRPAPGRGWRCSSRARPWRSPSWWAPRWSRSPRCLFVAEYSNRVRLRQLHVGPDGVRQAEPVTDLAARSMVVLQPHGSLFFASAPTLEAQLPHVRPDTAHSVVIIRLRGIPTSTWPPSPS